MDVIYTNVTKQKIGTKKNKNFSITKEITLGLYSLFKYNYVI